MNENLCYLLMFLFCCSCNSQKKDVKKIHVDNTASHIIKVAINKHASDINSIMDDVSFIPLETTSEGLIGKVKKFKIHKNRVYVLDKTTQSLLIFDTKGKYLNKICAQGRGPGEYSLIENFEIFNDNIIIGDNDHLKIIFYSLDGKFIRQKRLPFNFRDFAIVDGRYYFYCHHNNQRKLFKSHLIVCDSALNYIGNSFGSGESIETRSSNFANGLDRCLFSYGLSTDIYEINFDTIRIGYHIDFGDYNFPKTKKTTYEEVTSEQFWNQKYALFPDDIAESDRYVYFNFCFEKYLGRAFFHKATEQCKVIFRTSPDNPLSPVLQCRNNKTYNDQFVTLVNPISFIDRKEGLSEMSNPFLKDKMKNLLANIRENDNPILTFYTINFKNDWYE